MMLPSFLRSAQSSSASRKLVVALFALYAVIGLLVFRGYGVSWDEPFQRLQGMVSANHIIKIVAPAQAIPGFPDLATFWNRDYGVAFDTPAYFLELIFGADPAGPGIYYLRHFLVFLLFFIASTFMYRLARDYFKDWRLGLLATGLLVISPRFFAEAFYNNKDIVYLSAFIIALYCLYKFLEQKTPRSAVWFALASAFAVDIRITGVILPVVGGLLYLLEIALHKKVQGDHVSRESALKTFGWWLLWLLVFTIALWPYLWSSPFSNFYQAFLNMAHFRLDTPVLYFGEFVRSVALPWHYVPAWIGISVPVAYLLFFVIGLGFAVKNLVQAIRQRTYTAMARFSLMSGLLFFAPLLAVIVMHSVLYNGWRQMYFLYAPLVLLAVNGFAQLHAWLKTKHIPYAKLILPIIIGLALLSSTIQIIRLHPYEQAYFNILAGNPNGRFEGDYWGLSYRQSLAAITAADPSVPLALNVNTPPGRINAVFLEPSDQQRIIFTSPEQAKYILTDFTNQTCVFKDEISAWYAGDLKIMAIYKGGQACPSVFTGS